MKLCLMIIFQSNLLAIKKVNHLLKNQATGNRRRENHDKNRMTCYSYNVEIKLMISKYVIKGKLQ